VHVDLAQKHDHCAVALAHIDHWVTMKIAGQMKEASPKVVVDAVRWWTPTKDKSVDFADVRDYILELRHRGFNIKLVTFDRWNSHDMMQQMIAYGMKSEILSVAKKHYDDMQMVVVEERLVGPKINLLIEELLQLRIIKDKVDHPRKGSKDLSDAVCGAIYNAVSGTARNANQEVKVYDYASYHRETEEDYLKQNAGIIRMPESNYMPDSIRDYLAADIPQTEEQGFIDNFSIL
jgi:phage terminase large subunit-like protein